MNQSYPKYVRLTMDLLEFLDTTKDLDHDHIKQTLLNQTKLSKLKLAEIRASEALKLLMNWKVPIPSDVMSKEGYQSIYNLGNLITSNQSNYSSILEEINRILESI